MKKKIVTKKRPSLKPKRAGHAPPVFTYDELMEDFRKTPNKLLTAEHFAEKFNADLKLTRSALYYLFRHRKIQRHKTKTTRNQLQYALHIDPSNRNDYEPKRTAIPVLTAQTEDGETKIAHRPTAREIGNTFAQVQNALSTLQFQLARLEDLVTQTAQADEGAITALKKIQRALGN